MLFTIIFLPTTAFSYVQYSSGPNGTGTGANDTSSGSIAWDTPGNITAEDATVTKLDAGDAHVFDNAVKLVKGGTISGNNNFSTAEWPASLTYSSYGSSSDMWGLTFSPSDINSSNFGAVIQTSACAGTPVTSNYLKGTNFSFSIPTNAIIVGIVLEIKKSEGGACLGAGGGGASFVAGTKIATPDGDVNIENLKEGDVVYSYDPVTGNKWINRIVKAWNHIARELLFLRTHDNLVLTTPDHKILSKDGYKRADQLSGNFVMTQTRQATVYQKVRDITPLKKREQVYEFALKNEPHNYSANGFVVHNPPPACVAGTCANVDYMRITVYYQIPGQLQIH